MQEGLSLAEAVAGKSAPCSQKNREGTCADPGLFDARQLGDIESVGSLPVEDGVARAPKHRRRNTEKYREADRDRDRDRDGEGDGDRDREAPMHRRRHRGASTTTSDAVQKPRLTLLSDDHEI